MERGDLSNRLPPRWLFVYEGVIGRVPVEKRRQYDIYVKLRQYRRAAGCFVTEAHVQKVIWDLVWRRDFRFDVVTFLGDDMADALEKKLTGESLPFSNLWAVDEAELAARLAYMPDVVYVVHGDPSRRLAYGNRGLLVTDPERLVLL